MSSQALALPNFTSWFFTNLTNLYLLRRYSNTWMCSPFNFRFPLPPVLDLVWGHELLHILKLNGWFYIFNKGETPLWVWRMCLSVRPHGSLQPQRVNISVRRRFSVVDIYLPSFQGFLMIDDEAFRLLQGLRSHSQGLLHNCIEWHTMGKEWAIALAFRGLVRTVYFTCKSGLSCYSSDSNQE
jgi:hypothetical protein